MEKISVHHTFAIRKTGGTLRIQGSKPERSAFILLQIFGRGPGRHVCACFFTGYAFFILYFINVLTSHLCTKKEIPEEHQPGFFLTINILMTILLFSSYLGIP